MDTTTRSELAERLGLSSYKIGKRAGVDPKTVQAILAGEGKTTEKIAMVDAALAAFAHERGVAFPGELPAGTELLVPTRTVSSEEGPLVEFEVAGNFGVSVVVRGPIGEAAALEEAVLKLIKGLNDSGVAAEAEDAAS